MCKPSLSKFAVLLSLIPFVFSSGAFAADIIVHVTGIQSGEGEIGCTLFDDKKTFPMKAGKAAQWQKADQQGVQFRFTGVAPGTYAISIGHDLNGNKKVDTNWLGIPKEAWGVSNNVRPTMRPPRFKEAQFEIKGDEPLVLTIEIDK
ncbi:MAG: DUF2141 domain-containing protein [Acidobacteriota bacterium]|nr:DUF2141 domain-containing protein [Acidobacteriota bacterium]